MDKETRRFHIVNWTVALIGIGLLLYAFQAEGHEAPTGWRYPYLCCSGFDCAEAHDEWVREGPDGYEINIPAGGHHPMVNEVPFRELVSYHDKRIKDSPDGLFHVCIGAGYDRAGEGWKQKLLCLFVPPRLF